MKNFSNSLFYFLMFYRIVLSVGGQRLTAKHDQLERKFNSRDETLLEKWRTNVTETVKNGLNRPLLIRGRDTTLILNFDMELQEVLKEVKYLKQIGRFEIPEDTLEVKT